MLAKGGSEEDSRRSVRSGEGRMQICGLRDDGRTGTILLESKPDSKGKASYPQKCMGGRPWCNASSINVNTNISFYGYTYCTNIYSTGGIQRLLITGPSVITEEGKGRCSTLSTLRYLKPSEITSEITSSPVATVPKPVT